MTDLHKYPRTPHIRGSRLGPDDTDPDAVPFDRLAGRFLVVEEKLDGANAAISFAEDGELRLQSRGHYLTGGYRERHFSLLKSWATRFRTELYDALSTRYVMYGEWLYAKHTIYYDMLPHYFLEFDVLDRESGGFLSTERRQALLAGLPVESVPVLASGTIESLIALIGMIGPSRCKSADWRQSLNAAARAEGSNVERTMAESDQSDLMEGLYIKVEESGCVAERYKFVRAGFLAAVADSDSHWQSRPVFPNRLRPGIDLFK